MSRFVGKRLDACPAKVDDVPHMGRRPTPLAIFRARAQLTQQELAAKAGISASAIIDIERRNTRDPQMRTWQRLADALGVDITELFEPEEASA